MLSDIVCDLSGRQILSKHQNYLEENFAFKKTADCRFSISKNQGKQPVQQKSKFEHDAKTPACISQWRVFKHIIVLSVAMLHTNEYSVNINILKSEQGQIYKAMCVCKNMLLFCP